MRPAAPASCSHAAADRFAIALCGTGTFRLNLRLCEMGLCLDRLAQTESVFANGDVGLKGISLRANPSGLPGSYPGA